MGLDHNGQKDPANGPSKIGRSILDIANTIGIGGP